MNDASGAALVGEEQPRAPEESSLFLQAWRQLYLDVLNDPTDVESALPADPWADVRDRSPSRDLAW